MDRQTRLVWLGTAVAVAVVWAVGLTVGKQRTPPLATTEQPEALDVEPQEAPAAKATQSAPKSAPTSAPQPSTTPTPTPTPAPTAPHAKSPGELLPGVFATETVDAQWAPAAEASIRKAFADAQVPEGSLLAVECRRRLCRAEMWFETKDHESFGKAYAALREQFGTDVGFERIKSGIRGEPQHTAAYFPRKGYELEDFERPAAR